MTAPIRPKHRQAPYPEPYVLTRSTNYPAIANAPLPAEGSASFSNYHLAAAVLLVPWAITRFLPFRTSWTFYFFLVALTGIPVTVAYWMLASRFGPRLNEKVELPNKGVEHYIDLKNSELKKYVEKGRKLPMQLFHDEFFEGKVEFKGDVLDVMEYRHDWASFEFTPEVSLCLICSFISLWLLIAQPSPFASSLGPQLHQRTQLFY